MKIALIGHKGIPAKSGGVDRHVESLAFYLSKKNSNLEIISYNRKNYLQVRLSKDSKKYTQATLNNNATNNSDSFEDSQELHNIKIISLPFINSKNLAAISHGFLATLDAIIKKVDIIHYHGIGPCLLAWIPKLLRPKTKIIATLHSFDYGNDKWSAFAKFMLKMGEKFMAKYADEVIVLTSLMRDYLYQRHGRDSVIIPNGAKIQEAGNSEILKTFNLEEKKYLVSVSRLIRLKGIQYLIPAFKKLKKTNAISSDLKLVIVGDGEYEKELKKIANNDKDIVFTGNQSGDDLATLYSRALLFVQASEMEGLSISMLEAMAYGLPILASDISANREAGADTVKYFQAKNEEDLLINLKKVLNNFESLENLGKLAKERLEKVFNWERISGEILDLYKKILEKV